MCLLLLAYQYHPNYKIILAANRDEFYKRPALPLHNWKDHPELFAGKDLEGKGTWLGITKTGKLAVITNYRNMGSIKKDAPTRGKLVTDFLLNKIAAERYSDILIKTGNIYNGYNLIYGEIDNLYYFSNLKDKASKLSPGIYGLSNHLLDTPWPKVVKSKREFSKILEEETPSKYELFEILLDNEIFADEELPDTGLPRDLEKMVSPIFTSTDEYGTRSSSVILIDQDNNVLFMEKSLNDNKEWETSSIDFEIKK
jgi:uncharacterized protein with NRDE domain